MWEAYDLDNEDFYGLAFHFWEVSVAIRMPRAEWCRPLPCVLGCGNAVR
jgi:hypothetical protein